MLKSSLACVVLLCLLQASESRLSEKTLGVKGTHTRRKLGGRRRNGHARAKRHRQQPDISDVEARSHAENSSVTAPSHDESTNKRSGGGRGVPKSSAPQMASKNSHARKSADSMEKIADSNESVQAVSTERNNQDVETIDESTNTKIGDKQHIVGDKKQPRNKEGS